MRYCQTLAISSILFPGGSTAESATIILLPYGRMLVVDRSVFAQYGAEQTGINFMELSAELIREHNNRLQYTTGSTPSILDSSETTSKAGLSPTSLGVSPPAYDDIFGSKTWDLPPSYSELSIMLRTFGGGEEPEVTVRELNSVNNDSNSVVMMMSGEGERDVTIVDVDVCRNVRESSL